MIDTRLTLAKGTAERGAAAAMLQYKPAAKCVMVGADRGFVEKLLGLRVIPHVAQNTGNRR